MQSIELVVQRGEWRQRLRGFFRLLMSTLGSNISNTSNAKRYQFGCSVWLATCLHDHMFRTQNGCQINTTRMACVCVRWKGHEWRRSCRCMIYGRVTKLAQVYRLFERLKCFNASAVRLVYRKQINRRISIRFGILNTPTVVSISSSMQRFSSSHF